MAKRRKRALVAFLWFMLVNAAFLLIPRASYRALVIHHSAANVSDFYTIREAHRTRGWFESAYHLVLSNGSTDIPFGHLQPTRRYRLGLWSVATRSPRHNLTAIHLCVAGNFETSPVPAPLQVALGHAIQELQKRHGITADRIYLHRDCSPTACPGRNIDSARLTAWARLGSQAPQAIRAQHRKALDSVRLTPAFFHSIWAGANFALLLYLCGWRTERRSSESRSHLGLTSSPSSVRVSKGRSSVRSCQPG
ncbi:MAG: peptidoglycan recognition family protein [Acidobacteriota bacterium]